MTLTPSAHSHKPILVYASHQGLLQASIFKLLSNKAQYDSTLAAFLDSAFSGLQQELLAIQVNQVAHDAAADLLELPLTLESLASNKHHRAFEQCKIALTTIVHVATAICSRNDFRMAMSGEFPAIWDPESALAIHLLQHVDVSNSLQVIQHALEAIRLACWLDYYLIQKVVKGACKRVLAHGDDKMLATVRELADVEGILYEHTLRGLVLGISDSTQLQKIRAKAGATDALVLTKISSLPMITVAEVPGPGLVQSLKERVDYRGIQYPLESSSGASLVSFLTAFAGHLNHGQSSDHVQQSIDTVKQLSLSAVLYGSRVSLLILGHPSVDFCSTKLASKMSSIDIEHSTVQLNHFLYVKDATRFGDEPVKLSKVEGNPCQQIAIIGMSCRLPGANDASELWEMLQKGGDMCSKIPDTLYNYQDYHSSSYRDRNVMRVTTGNFVSVSQLFDRSLLSREGVTVEDCQQMDPQHRLALLATFETLQQGGYGFSKYKPPFNAGDWSSHVAYCSDDYREHVSHDIRPGFVANTHRAHLVALINETFGFQGEACTYDTACSSALVAIEAACNSLLSGASSSVITGGVNILTQPQITIGLDRGFFLSAASQCMTLDDAGAGYSRADAVSLMLLKRLPDAVRDGDTILALISSAATNHSGESFSITHPHGPTQQRLYRSGMLASGTLPEDFSYIEMHGTGTQSGDLEEVTGIISTFGDAKRQGRLPLVLGSVKANIGHSEAASGSSSIVKTLKIYEKGLVPKHVGIRTKLNTKLPSLEGFEVPIEAVPLVDLDHSCTLVDNFSAAGGNSSIVLDKGSRYNARLLQEQKTIRADDSEYPHLLFVTAANSFSLDAKRRRLAAFLDESSSVNIKDFCCAVSLSDPMFQHRLLATPSNIGEAKACLGGQESVTLPPRPRDLALHVGIAFSGQGSQYLDMGKELYEHSPAFRAHIDQCGIIASSLHLPDLIEVIRPSPVTASTSSVPMGQRTADSFSPAQFQLALVAIQIGLASMLIDWGVRPIAVVGHSLGEYAALWMAQVLSLRDVLSLVGARAMLMMELCEPHASSMLAVRAGSTEVQSLLDGSGLDNLEIACLNSPIDTVVAGKTAEIEKLRILCDSSEPRIKAMAIPVPYAFHSKSVEALMIPYAEVLKKHRLNAAKLLLGSNVLGTVIHPGSREIDQEYLVRHLRQPVRFFEAVSQLQGKMNVEHWIDLGPHPTCIPMLKGCYVDQPCQPVFTASLRRGISSWQAILDLVVNLASYDVKLDWSKVWNGLGLFYANSSLAPKLPLYPFDLEEHWIPFKDRGLRDHLVENPMLATQTTMRALTGHKSKRDGKRLQVKEHRLSKPVHALLSSCVELSITPPSAKFHSRVNQSPFRDFIRGHIILEVPLAPATVFVELAQEAAHYWWQAAKVQNPQADSEIVTEVLDLSMVASLYLDEHNPNQKVEVTMQGDVASPDGCIVQFFSHSQHQRQQHQFGSCRVRAVAIQTVQQEWSKLSHLIQTTAKGVTAHPDSILKLDTIYSQFETIVLYLGGFRGMNQIWMTDGGEAVSLVRYSPQALLGRYLCSPMLLDSLGGLTGFISNVSFAEDKWIYMAEAIGRVVTTPELGRLQPGSDTKINVYARMEQHNDLSTGSAYFFAEGGVLMGMMEGIVFKRIRRDVLRRLVHMSSKAFAEEAKRAANSLEVSQASAVAMKPAVPNKTLKPTTTNTQVDFDVDLMHASVLPHHLGGPAVRTFDKSPTLFLFPDGTGLARSYPRLDDAAISIYGFESPYLGQPKDWSRGVSQLIERYVDMLLKVQPQGPYRIGGWSIGGVIALQVARHLLSCGQQVLFLGLIDTPYAAQIKPLSTQTLEGMLSRIGSSTVREHFRSCALSLPNYRCLPFKHNDKKPDQVVIVNATNQTSMEGLMSSQSEWTNFWSDTAKLVYKEVKGDHWSCVQAAMREIDKLAK